MDTVKRLCIKKLPPILAIQLKRFDYDWERYGYYVLHKFILIIIFNPVYLVLFGASVSLLMLKLIFFRECAIKFNDYFEFPRDLDMEPYTVQGLAKIEGIFMVQSFCVFSTNFNNALFT